jgi:hypothetical protein
MGQMKTKNEKRKICEEIQTKQGANKRIVKGNWVEYNQMLTRAALLAGAGASTASTELFLIWQ